MKPYPNVYAKKDGFDPPKAEQSGTRCNYRDPAHVELTCSGRGHLAKRRRQAEAEAAKSRSIEGVSQPRPSAVTQPLGTKSACGPRPVGQAVNPRAKPSGDAGRRTVSRPKPKYRVARKARPEHTRITGETDDEDDEQDDAEFDQVDGAEDDADDFDDEDDNGEQDAAPDEEEAEVEPSSLVYESRFHPVSQGDFDFGEDAMYPCGVRWGAEPLWRGRTKLEGPRPNDQGS